MRLITTKEFIERARKVHGHKYDYSKSIYKGSSTKVEIICLKHGSFLQDSHSHLKGSGCSNCRGGIKSNKINFIEKSNKKHNHIYDYSKFSYINSKIKGEIVCSEHGSFFQTPNNHLDGKGCARCKGQNKTTKDIIDEFKEIHGNKYDYSAVDYINTSTPVNIICLKHGSFFSKTKSSFIE